VSHHPAPLPTAAVTAVIALTALGALASAALARPAAQVAPAPVIVMSTSNLGKVLATPGRLGLYYWTTEKKAGGRIRCTGSCAVAWPPVYVKGAVPKRVAGLSATLGSIARGSKRQLTINGLPAYTYHHDPPGTVLCDDVGGWFAFRAR
jgi:predicted lipoprotein with Yx(FWY)xxD motif